MANSLSSDDSSSSDIEISCGNLQSLTADLSIDDFNDEDLSEITEEKTLRHSFVNGRYKKHKVKMSPSQISEHMKKISPDMIQLDLSGESPIDNSGVVLENGRKSQISPPRPQTLNLFSESTTYGSSNARNGIRSNCQNGRVVQSTSQDSLHSRVPSKTREDSKNEANHEENNKKEKSKNEKQDKNRSDQFLTRSASEWSIDDPESVEYCYLNGEIKKQTHVAAFKFVPRHSDELNLEIYDPIHVEVQADDLWYEGLNMRTGERGAFPCYYAQSIVSYLDELTVCEDEVWERFFLYFIGSVEVPCHKGNDVLCQAMYKVAEARRETLHSSPPAYVCLMVGTRGVKMIDQSDLKYYKSNRTTNANRHRLFSSSCKVKQQTHFFQLKNVSFCGHHPRNQKYFGCITRHPTEYRFACHTFVSEHSTRPIIDHFGKTFSQYFQDYMEFVQPSDDIYLE
uniref:C-Jun-amino-terminal kinase-interacting protein 1-like n=1 Tax=Styela clava TaxID=7725 RepID=UPI00193A42B8|nr:C-Jun-amino-terminal kinase-interacting protein 1-like [Styela clava]